MKFNLIIYGRSQYCLCQRTTFVHDSIRKVIFFSSNLNCQNVFRTGKGNVSNDIADFYYQIVLNQNSRVFIGFDCRITFCVD